MAYLEPKLVTKLAQKQVLTPGLVQMVSLLTLNKLELTEMIQQELVQNPVLEEGTEIVESTTPEIELGQEAPEQSAEADGTDAEYQALMDAAARDHCVTEPEPTAESTVEVAAPAEPEPAADDPYGDIDFQSFDQYLNDGASRPRETEIFEKPSFENFLAKPQTLTDHLEWQLGLATVDENIRLACHSIIGNLNEDGYLCAVDETGREIPITLEEIAESGEHTIEDVQKALEVVQLFDPPGVAARDIRECLMIQLRVLGEDESLAVDIVRDHLHKVQNKQFKEIAKALNKPLAAIMEEVEIIKHLDPRPGQKYNRSQPRLIEPDVFIVKVGGQYTVVTNEDEVPQLRLSPTYRHMLERDSLNKDVKNYVKDCFKSAVQLLKNIEQRKHIIVKVCEAIIRRQGDFLDKGIDQLKPMMIKDVAEEVGVHPSTVSRAVANKFAHTAQGVFELRFFFSEAVNGPMGNGTSLLIVKRKVKRYIENEDPRSPLTDEKIAQMLKEEGISVTRRSITKYREDLRICWGCICRARRLKRRLQQGYPMSVDITGRRIEVTEPIRKFATDRLERLRGIIDEILEVHLILTVEKHQRHIAEANIKTRRDFYHGEEVSTDMYTSIAAVIDKVEKQILKDKERNVARKRHNNNHKGAEVITTTSVLEVEEVLGERLPRIIRNNEVAAKPMSVDDAAVQIGGSDRDFLVFRNAQTERLNVVYKRKDGNIGWIEPEA